jgi:L-gulonate 5-dehydrogenase
MKVIKVTSPGNIECVEEPVPHLRSEDSVILKVHAAGICGSDISIYKGTSPVATYPRVIGHEFAGEIIETGKNVKNVVKGDHVCVNPVVGCGKCRVCLKGRSNVCDDLNVIGVHLDGGYSEYVEVPAANCFVVPDNMPWEIAAIVEPYSVAAQVTSRGGVSAGDIVLILGAGQIALTVLQVCKLLGAKVIITDIVEERLTRALSFGADYVINSGKADVQEEVQRLTDGIGADISIDAACVGETLKQAVICTRNAGVVVTMGFADRPIQATELQITKNELDIRGSRLNNHKFSQVIEWFVSGKIEPSRIITDHFKFTNVVKGMDKVKEDPEHTMKVILEFD